MAKDSIRVLLVDDYGPFRQFLRIALEKTSTLQHCYEASDGMEGVRKAQELQPELILLDVGLPQINGIEAARRILALCPNTKIVFVSQQSSGDVIEAALGTGAHGFVVKSDVGTDLLPAIDTVLRGGTFVSARFRADRLRGAASRAQASQKDKVQPSLRHQAAFYSDDASCVESFAKFVAEALKSGTAAVFVGTERYRNSVSGVLQQLYAIDVAAVVKEGQYIQLDAADVLSSFMIDGLPDPNRFLKTTGNLIGEAAKSVTRDRAPVRACGQCAPLLWSQGNSDAAIRVEQLWNEAVAIYNVEVFCGYPLTSFQGGIGSHVFEKICAEHSAVHSR